MPLDNDKFLLSEFKRVMKRNSGEIFVNLDDKFTEKFGLFIQKIEDVIKETGNNIAPNRWSYHRLALITKGAVHYTCGIYKFRADKNTLIVIPARVVTTSKWTDGTDGYIILFNLDFFLQNLFPHKYIESKKILQPTIEPYLHLSDEQASKVETIFKTLLTEKKKNRSHKNELMALKVIELLILCERLYSEVHDFEDDNLTLDIVKKFSDLVEANFMNERSVGFYARQLHIHPNYLNALVKKYTGLKAKESIRNRLILETKYLLHSTNLTIKEIAGQMGFDDPNYFTAFFKRCENTSPVLYRASFV